MAISLSLILELYIPTTDITHIAQALNVIY